MDAIKGLQIKSPKLILIAFVISVLIMTLVFIRDRRQGNCTNLVQTFLHEEFEGVLIRKEKIQEQHNTPVFFLSDRVKPIYVNGMIDTGLYDKVKKGDLLIKKSNELRCMVIRGSDTLVFVREEPDCDKFRSRDE